MDIDEDDFLNFIKNINPDDKDIQNKNSIEELIEDFGCIDEFEDELNRYTFDKEKKCYSSYVSYYDNYEDAL